MVCFRAAVSLLTVGVLFPSLCGGLETLEWPWIPDASLEDDYESMGYPQSSGGPIVQWSLNTSVPSTGRNYTIHVGSLASGLPETFSFEIPNGGKLSKSSIDV